LRHVLRPRVLVYTAILGSVVLAMLISLATRTPFKVDVVRDRGALARIVAGGKIENVYRLQIMNATESNQRFHITVSGLPGLTLEPTGDVLIESTQSRWIAVTVQSPYEVAAPGSHPIQFEIALQDASAKTLEKSVFIVPR
jgi:polyferredoxin